MSFTLPTPHVTRSAPRTTHTISLLGGDPDTVAALRAGLENGVQAAVVDGPAADRAASLTVLLDPVDDSDPSQLPQAVGAAVSRAGGTDPGAAGLVALDDAPGAHADRTGPLVAYRRSGTTPSVSELLSTIQALAATTRPTNGESP